MPDPGQEQDRAQHHGAETGEEEDGAMSASATAR